MRFRRRHPEPAEPEALLAALRVKPPPQQQEQQRQ
jgi:hypothetical protein